ncbi:hypothetical protein Golomagni_02583 [Golovinomyces magnicellulatus]|nr:hypothetical protein Golomagni_02583 [Golovinomyces magnicellulatus]
MTPSLQRPQRGWSCVKNAKCPNPAVRTPATRWRTRRKAPVHFTRPSHLSKPLARYLGVVSVLLRNKHPFVPAPEGSHRSSQDRLVLLPDRLRMARALE